MHKIVYTNELYHFGILGQKWGIRRYQNPDGTLTEAGKKRLSKLNKYKDKQLEKTKIRIQTNKNLVESAKYNRDELLKRGTDSAAYQKWEKEDMIDKQREFERKEKEKQQEDPNYVLQSYISSGKFITDDLHRSLLSDSKVKELIDDYNSQIFWGEQALQKLNNKQNNLANMKVDVLMSKRDIRNNASVSNKRQ